MIGAVSSNVGRVAQAARAMMVFRLVMGAIAGISLVVGGIGIMNVLLASVTDRTREIGIRRASGARRRDIRRQFLAESVAISAVGCTVLDERQRLPSCHGSGDVADRCACGWAGPATGEACRRCETGTYSAGPDTIRNDPILQGVVDDSEPCRCRRVRRLPRPRVRRRQRANR
jgi:hypothetical protein